MDLVSQFCIFTNGLKIYKNIYLEGYITLILQNLETKGRKVNLETIKKVKFVKKLLSKLKPKLNENIDLS